MSEIYLNNIKLSQNWSGYPDNKIDGAEISNDIDKYKSLMIVGNRSNNNIRNIGVWDNLKVNGNLSVTNKLCVNGQCINENTLKNLVDQTSRTKVNYTSNDGKIIQLRQGDKCIGFNGNTFMLGKCNNNDTTQLYDIIKDGDNIKLRNKINNKCVDNNGSGTITNYDCVSHPNQTFTLTKNSNDTYEFMSLGGDNRKCMSCDVNTNACQYDVCNSLNKNQQFNSDIINYTRQPTNNVNVGRTMQIKIGDKCVNYNKNTQNFDLVQCNNLDSAQLFDIVNDGNFIKFKNKDTSQCIDNNNNNMILNNCSSLPSQNFILTNNNNNTIELRTQDNKCITCDINSNKCKFDYCNPIVTGQQINVTKIPVVYDQPKINKYGRLINSSMTTSNLDLEGGIYSPGEGSLLAPIGQCGINSENRLCYWKYTDDGRLENINGLGVGILKDIDPNSPTEVRAALSKKCARGTTQQDCYWDFNNGVLKNKKYNLTACMPGHVGIYDYCPGRADSLFKLYYDSVPPQ